jgi:hypothetical protein
MRALAILALVPATAAARPDVSGGAQLHYELTGVHAVDATRDHPRDLVLAGACLHGFIGRDSIGFHLGLDLAAGSTIDGAGFAYDVALYPLGVAWRFLDTSFVTLGAGIGASGAVGTMSDAASLPVELRFELGRGIRVLGRARATFVDDRAATRQDGARFADELDAMLALRLGRGYGDWGFPTGNGYFAGVAYRELYGARFVGAVIGYSVDMGTPR